MAPWNPFTKISVLVIGVLMLICCRVVWAVDTYDILQHCGGKISMVQWRQYSFRLQMTHNVSGVSYDCSVSVQTWNRDHRLLLYFTNLAINRGGNCTKSHLRVYDGFATSSHMVSGLPEDICGSSLPGVYYSSNNTLTFRYVTDGSDTLDSFGVIITEYHSGQCDDDEERCSNDRCISDQIACGGDNPCGDNSDCDENDFYFMTILVPVLCVLGVVITILSIVLYRNRIRSIPVPHTMIINSETTRVPVKKKLFRSKNKKTYGGTEEQADIML